MSPQDHPQIFLFLILQKDYRRRIQAFPSRFPLICTRIHGKREALAQALGYPLNLILHHEKQKEKEETIYVPWKPPAFSFRIHVTIFLSTENPSGVWCISRAPPTSMHSTSMHSYSLKNESSTTDGLTRLLKAIESTA